MLKTLFIITKHSFLIQRREQVFYASICISFFMLLFAHFINDLTLEYSTKILFDIIAFCLSFLGGMIAIFWGCQSLSFSRNSPPDVSLTTPVSRTTWVIGQYLGISVTLFLVICFNLFMWQIILLFNNFPILRFDELIAFPLYLLSWLVMVALSFLFSSFSGRSTALFLTVSCWLIGIINPILIEYSENETFSSSIISLFAQVWNLQHFKVTPEHSISLESFSMIFLYGFSLILLFVNLTCLIVENKDI